MSALNLIMATVIASKAPPSDVTGVNPDLFLQINCTVEKKKSKQYRRGEVVTSTLFGGERSSPAVATARETFAPVSEYPIQMTDYFSQFRLDASSGVC